MDSFPFGDSTGISEKIRSSSMDKIKKSDPSSSRDAASDQDKRKREPGVDAARDQGDEAGDHFESLKKSADLINADLERKNSHYRFYIFREYEDIFINLVRLDGMGEIVEIKKKNITHQEFNDLIRHLENGEGLIIDRAG
jgi:hypothetical protein